MFDDTSYGRYLLYATLSFWSTLRGIELGCGRIGLGPSTPGHQITGWFCFKITKVCNFAHSSMHLHLTVYNRSSALRSAGWATLHLPRARYSTSATASAWKSTYGVDYGQHPILFQVSYVEGQVRHRADGHHRPGRIPEPFALTPNPGLSPITTGL